LGLSALWFIANDKSWLKANKQLYSLCMAKKSQMFIVCFDGFTSTNVAMG
jgi:hypothetical protein